MSRVSQEPPGHLLDMLSRRTAILTHTSLGLAILGLVGALLMVSVSMVALPASQQAIVAVATIAIFMVVNRFRSQGATLFLIVLSVMVSVRYIVWRLTETLEFNSWLQAVLGTVLGLAELYAIMMLLLGYFQTAWPLDRKPLPLPPSIAQWPTVDIYVPTYNEDLTIVRSTVLAALAIDWPRDKLNVYILDDGRRVAFRDFAESCGCGYIIRPDNLHAKAGNLNHALRQTDGRFVAVFDCDHIPTRAFLQMTMGWMIAEPKLALLQTPHHFYSHDPFQRNLAAGTRVPAEGNMFYGLVQDGNDFWNATFFCGSCAVIRREALTSVGGFATETVTEDAHTALKLQREGWSTAYLRLPLAAGLATERLILHIGQRVRWARGMLQIMRIDNPLLGHGLSWGQRLCYLAAMMHFMFAIPRVVFLAAPLAFLFLGQNIIAASPLAITAYALPHMFHSIATGSRLQRNWRHSFWSEIYETVLALFLVRVTIVTLLSPRRGKFNVTDKGGLLENGYFDLRAVYPNIILALMLSGGLLRGVIGMVFQHPDTLTFQALLLNSIWVSFSLLTVMGALAVGRETRQTRKRARIPVELPMSIIAADGRMFACKSENLSLGGARVRLNWPEPVEEPVPISVTFTVDTRPVVIPAMLLRQNGNSAYVKWSPDSIADESAIVRTVFGRADAWINWGNYPVDKPLLGLWAVLVSIRGLFRARGQVLTRQQVMAIERTSEVPVDRLGKQSLVVRPRGTVIAGAAAIAFFCMVASRPAGAQSVRLDTAGSATSVDATSNPPMPSSGPSLGPPSAPASTTSTSGARNAGGQAATASVLPVGAPADGTTTTFTFRELGAGSPMTMRGTSPIQGLTFGVPADKVVTGGQLILSGAMSPSLIPEASAVTITINEQYVGTLHVDPDHPAFGPIMMPIDPIFFSGENHINFRFAGQYTRSCNDPLSALLWATVSNHSRLSLTTVPIPPRRQLSRLPLPFFDRNVRQKAIVPVVLPSVPTNEVLRAAAVTASWLGQLTDFRGVSFPVSNDMPQSGSAIAIGLRSQLPAGLVGDLPDGPTLTEVANPNDPNGTILVVTGRNGAEVVAAAQALALGTDTLGATASALVTPPDIGSRKPYDAPAFVPTDRVVRFGELVAASDLEGVGYAPGTMSVPFRTAPDLYTWRSRPFGLDVHYRAPDGPILDVAASRLDVGINNIYLRSYSLEPPASPMEWLQRLVHTRVGAIQRGASLPPWMVFGQNQLQFYFDARPLHRGDCAAVPGDIHTGVDPDSTLDLTRAYHFTTLPNLSFFASAGFPFTRMADLSETAIVLPPRPGTVTLSAFLDLMGFFGATTWYPTTGVAVTTADQLDGVSGRDLIVMGTVAELGRGAQLLSEAPYQVSGNRLVIARRSPLDGIWYLFGDHGGSTDKRQPAVSGLDTTLSDGGALIGAQSPLSSHRSVVAFLSGTPQGLGALVQALRGKTEQPQIQGDLILMNANRLTAYRTGASYTVGWLPLWLWPDWLLRDRPIGMLVFALIGCGAMCVVLFRLLSGRAYRRNRQTGPSSGPKP